MATAGRGNTWIAGPTASPSALPTIPRERQFSSTPDRRNASRHDMTKLHFRSLYVSVNKSPALREHVRLTPWAGFIATFRLRARVEQGNKTTGRTWDTENRMPTNGKWAPWSSSPSPQPPAPHGCRWRCSMESRHPIAATRAGTWAAGTIWKHPSHGGMAVAHHDFRVSRIKKTTPRTTETIFAFN